MGRPDETPQRKKKNQEAETARTALWNMLQTTPDTEDPPSRRKAKKVHADVRDRTKKTLRERDLTPSEEKLKSREKQNENMHRGRTRREREREPLSAYGGEEIRLPKGPSDLVRVQ